MLAPKFTVKSAYEAHSDYHEEEMDKRCKLIWKFRGPQRIRVFQWLAAKNRILTNSERRRRHMTGDPSCPLCDCVRENTSHVLRFCPTARALWTSLIKHIKTDEFLCMDINDWIFTNVQQPSYFPKASQDWEVVFGAVCWHLWKQRNGMLFDLDYKDH